MGGFPQGVDPRIEVIDSRKEGVDSRKEGAQSLSSKSGEIY
jgi:hypothetical protein